MTISLDNLFSAIRCSTSSKYTTRDASSFFFMLHKGPRDEVKRRRRINNNCLLFTYIFSFLHVSFSNIYIYIYPSLLMSRRLCLTLWTTLIQFCPTHGITRPPLFNSFKNSPTNSSPRISLYARSRRVNCSQDFWICDVQTSSTHITRDAHEFLHHADKLRIRK